MAITKSPRLDLNRWSADGDRFTRAHLDHNFARIEGVDRTSGTPGDGRIGVAGFITGSRPTGDLAKFNAFIHWDGNAVYYCDGSEWHQFVANGWTPVIAVETRTSDSARVLKIVDWAGGSENKPLLPDPAYLGETGFVAIADATSIRGATGPQGPMGATGPKGDKGDQGDITGVTAGTGLTGGGTSGTVTLDVQQSYVDGRANTRAAARFTDAEKSKLSGIETGAQRNVGSEFTSSEKTKLAGLSNTTAQALTSASAISWAVGSDSELGTVTLSHNTTLTLTGGSSGTVAVLAATQDSTGSRTLALASGIEHGSTSEPALTTAADKTDLLFFLRVGTTWLYLGILKDVE